MKRVDYLSLRQDVSEGGGLAIHFARTSFFFWGGRAKTVRSGRGRLDGRTGLAMDVRSVIDVSLIRNANEAKGKEKEGIRSLDSNLKGEGGGGVSLKLWKSTVHTYIRAMVNICMQVCMYHFPFFRLFDPAPSESRGTLPGLA